jgi:PAS domain
MVFADAKASNHPLIFANDSFLSLAGYDREVVLSQSFDFLMGRCDRVTEDIEAGRHPFAFRKSRTFSVRGRRRDSLSLLKTLNAGETPGFLWLSEF